jgi:methylenetetrahydrofolate reductase (NADPH)
LRVPTLYTRPQPTISFEFFPPKSDEAEAALFRQTVPGLKELGPSFISVTYGAGGGTRDRSMRIVSRIRREFGIESVAHLTCVASSKETIGRFLEEAKSAGIDNILALRGDPPRGQTAFVPEPGGFSYAVDLIRYIKPWNGFSIGAAAYPEGHSECPDKYLDWDRTVAKVEAGAEYLLTQLFYDIDDFLQFEDYLQNRRGITVPIVPGVLPFLSAEQIKRMTALCGARLPEPLGKRLDSYGADDESVRQLGVDYCTELCRRLLDHGVPGIHFYCLNRVPSCAEIMRNLALANPPCEVGRS